MRFAINRSTVICLKGFSHTAVRFAAEAFCKDVERVIGKSPRIVDDASSESSTILIETSEPRGPNWNQRETYRRVVIEEGSTLHLAATDPLGAVYGLFDLSRDFLGIDPMQFWTGHKPARQEHVQIPGAMYEPPIPAVRMRGWFVNGEDCLIGWSDEFPIPNTIWEKIYETILRCRGNLVIPGTDLPRDSPHRQLAADMGLWLTHHHAEPLGAEMFSRAFPELPPRYDLYRDKFLDLYRSAIEEQKRWKIVWTLGFRGQGDRPFWEDDPRYTNPQDRGKLLTEIIAEQHDLIRANAGHDNTAMCFNLYGEAVELYRDGHFRLPADVIRVWGDNGYGAMVSRRMWTNNPRHRALPLEDERKLRHGVYYHVNFHDLQASNQLAMLVNPDLIEHELGGAIAAGADDLVIVNCGNIRPHILDLEYVTRLLQETTPAVDFIDTFCQKHFGDAWRDTSRCYRDYFRALWNTSAHEDEKAGDELYFFTAKHLVRHCLRHDTDHPVVELQWATSADANFCQQLQWFADHSGRAQPAFDALAASVHRTHKIIRSPSGRRFFHNNLLTQVLLHHRANAGLMLLCEGIGRHLNSDHIAAFLTLTRAIEQFEAALAALRATEHDQWVHFYRGDWLVGVAETIRQLRLLRSYFRGVDDVLFHTWMRRIIPKADRRVALGMVWRRPKDDDELAFWLEHPERATVEKLHSGNWKDRT